MNHEMDWNKVDDEALRKSFEESFEAGQDARMRREEAFLKLFLNDPTTQSRGIIATSGPGPAIPAELSAESLLALIKPLEEERLRTNANMVQALKGIIEASREGMVVWAERLRVGIFTLWDVLGGKKDPNWYFWEQVERVFGGVKCTDCALGNTTIVMTIPHKTPEVGPDHVVE